MGVDVGTGGTRAVLIDVPKIGPMHRLRRHAAYYMKLE